MAIEQIRQAMGIDLSSTFRSDLANVKSWITDENGRDIYDHLVAERRI